MNRPIACIGDEALLDDVLRQAAVAGCPLDRVPDAAALRARWHDSPLVVLDGDTAQACHVSNLPKRESVVVVCSGAPPPSVWAAALALGASRVIGLAEDHDWLVGAFADAAEAPSGRSGPVLAVVGGRGGAGASVFAAALGLTALHEGHNALLIDCDPLGGGLDLVLGAERQPGLRWPDLRLKSGRVAASSLRSALPGRARGDTRLTVLSGARVGAGPTAAAVAAVVEAGWRAGDTVVCDLPRHPDESADSALAHVGLAAVVVPADVRSCAAARRVAVWLAERGVRAGAVVRGPSPSRLRPPEIAAAVGLPLLAVLPPEPNLARALDQGTFRVRSRGPLARAARTVLDAVPA